MRACHGVHALLITKFSGDETAPTDADVPDGVVAALRDCLDGRREFLHTVGHLRADGAYVVERRNAMSPGHSKVFDPPHALVDLYERLPDTFTASDMEQVGVTDTRRHLLLWHLVEHPAFDCDLDSRQPLAATKRPADADGGGKI